MHARFNSRFSGLFWLANGPQMSQNTFAAILGAENALHDIQ